VAQDRYFSNIWWKRF